MLGGNLVSLLYGDVSVIVMHCILITIYGRVLVFAAHSVNRMCIFVILVISHLGFDDRSFVLISLTPIHCLPLVTFVNC